MQAYHELPVSTLDKVLKQGLVQGETGSKTDEDIHNTDVFLNRYRPALYERRGLDREKNIYCYLAFNDEVIDITSGTPKSPAAIVANKEQVLLLLQVDPQRCYVSNLDLYDQIVKLVKMNSPQAKKLAQDYWYSLQQLAAYDDSMRRPEVIVTYNIAPSAISQVIR